MAEAKANREWKKRSKLKLTDIMITSYKAKRNGKYGE